MPARGVRAAAILLVPALLFAALYLRALDYPFVWTDHDEIERGSVLRPPGRILAAFGEPLHAVDDIRTRFLLQPYYRPLQVVTASALDAAFGRRPRTFRAASLLVGAATASLFTAVAWTLLGSAPGALLAGSIFAAHPVGLETYVWISGLSAALGAFFLMGSLGLALRALGGRAAAAHWGFGAASLVALGLALLSKENAVLGPAWLLAAGLGLRATTRRDGARPGPSARRLALWVGAQSAVVLLYLFALRPAVMGTVVPGVPPILENPLTQLATALGHWPEALAWLFVPLHSNTSDAVRVATSVLAPLPLLGAALGLGSCAAWLTLLRLGRGRDSVGLAWLWLGFLPTSGLLPVLHLGAERNLFLPALGAALLWACAALLLVRVGLPRAVAVGLAALLVLGLAQRTGERTPDWRSTRILFERDLARDPWHREGRYNLIAELVEAGRHVEAMRHADVLVVQRRRRDVWWSYLLDERVLEVHCRLNRLLQRSRDTLALYDESVHEELRHAWDMPGYAACLVETLEDAGRGVEARAYAEQLQRMEALRQRTRAP